MAQAAVESPSTRCPRSQISPLVAGKTFDELLKMPMIEKRALLLPRASAGRMSSALQLFEETCAGYERTIGANHASTLACQAELDRAVVHSTINRRGSKDSQLR